MLGKIIFGLIGLIVIVILLGFVLPDRVETERETIINAPQDDVYALISNFEAWDAWSPWAKLDPDMDVTITGDGVGHRMSWKSDDPNVGNGSQVVSAMDAPSSLTTRLEFEGMGNADAGFTLSPTADGATKVVWSFETNMREGMPLHMQPLVTYLGFFMGDMVGAQYEEGLADLKRVAEAG